jgi:hypothetical protein
VNNFPPEQADRASLVFSAKNVSRVTLGVWSKKRSLAPGEILRLDADYEAR